MTYETMDWEAEAVRVARAFRVQGKYKFERHSSTSNTFLFVNPDYDWRVEYVLPVTREGFVLSVHYSPLRRLFDIGKGDYNTTLSIDWDDKPFFAGRSFLYTTEICRGLFHLDLLSPEVEASLKLNISNHEKLEWTREYEDIYGANQ